MTEHENREKGRQLMERMMGRKVGETQTAQFPEWQDWTQRVLFGEVWTRETVDLKMRSLCVVAALTVLYRPEQLRAHVIGALNNGAAPEEIIEIIMQMGFYGGWPTAVTALGVAGKVFEERGLEIKK